MHVRFYEHRSTNDLDQTCNSSIESTGSEVLRCSAVRSPMAFAEFGRTLGSLTAGRGFYPNVGKIIEDLLACLTVM